MDRTISIRDILKQNNIDIKKMKIYGEDRFARINQYYMAFRSNEYGAYVEVRDVSMPSACGSNRGLIAYIPVSDLKRYGLAERKDAFPPALAVAFSLYPEKVKK